MNPEALWIQSLRVFMEVSLYKHDWSNHGLLVTYRWDVNLQAPSPLWRFEVGLKDGTEISSHLIMPQSFWSPASILTLSKGLPSYLSSANSDLVERGSLWITKDVPLTQEIPRVLGVLCQEAGTKNKYIFPITHTLHVMALETGPMSLPHLGPSHSTQHWALYSIGC